MGIDMSQSKCPWCDEPCDNQECPWKKNEFLKRIKKPSFTGDVIKIPDIKND